MELHVTYDMGPRMRNGPWRVNFFVFVFGVFPAWYRTSKTHLFFTYRLVMKLLVSLLMHENVHLMYFACGFK